MIQLNRKRRSIDKVASPQQRLGAKKTGKVSRGYKVARVPSRGADLRQLWFPPSIIVSTSSRGSKRAARKTVGPKIAAARSHRDPGLGQPQESRTLGSSSRPWDGEKNTRGPKKQPWLGQARALGSKSNFGDGQAKHRGPKKLPLLGQTWARAADLGMGRNLAFVVFSTGGQ